MRLLNIVVIGALILAASFVYKIKFDSTLQAERVGKVATELRRERNAVRLGERAYLACRRQSAAVRDIGLCHFAAARGEEIAKLAEMREPFAGGNGGRDRGIDARQIRDIFRPARLLKKIQPVGFESLCKLHAHCRRRPRMTVDHDIDVRTDGGAHALHRGRRRADRSGAFKRRGRRYRHRLECRKAALDRLPRKIGKAVGIGHRGFVEVFHASATQMTVEAQVIAYPTAPQAMTGHSQNLSRKIPQGDVYARYGGRAHDAAAVPEMLPKHHLPQMLDARRVFADHQCCKILERTHHRARVPFKRRLAPTDEAGFVGLDFDEDPIAHARVAHDRFDCGDLHDLSRVRLPADPSSIAADNDTCPSP